MHSRKATVTHGPRRESLFSIAIPASINTHGRLFRQKKTSIYSEIVFRRQISPKNYKHMFFMFCAVWTLRPEFIFKLKYRVSQNLITFFGFSPPQGAQRAPQGVQSAPHRVQRAPWGSKRFAERSQKTDAQ